MSRCPPDFVGPAGPTGPWLCPLPRQGSVLIVRQWTAQWQGLRVGISVTSPASGIPGPQEGFGRSPVIRSINPMWETTAPSDLRVQSASGQPVPALSALIRAPAGRLREKIAKIQRKKHCCVQRNAKFSFNDGGLYFFNRIFFW